MPSFDVTVELTPRQVAKVKELLIVMNAQRETQNLPPYEDVFAMASDAMLEQLKGWAAMADAQEIKDFKIAFEAADDAKRDEVRAILFPVNPDPED